MPGLESQRSLLNRGKSTLALEGASKQSRPKLYWFGLIWLQKTDPRQLNHDGRPFRSKRGWRSPRPNFCWRRAELAACSLAFCVHYLNSWSIIIVAGASGGREVCGDSGSSSAEGAFSNIIFNESVRCIWCGFWFHSYFKPVVLHIDCSFRFMSTILAAGVDVATWKKFELALNGCLFLAFCLLFAFFLVSLLVISITWIYCRSMISLASPGRNFTNQVPQPEAQGVLLSGFEPLVNRNLSLAGAFSTGFAARPWGSNVTVIGKFVLSWVLVCRHFN